MEIRGIQNKDLEEVADLEKVCYERERLTKDELTTLIKDMSVGGYVLTDDHKVIGYVIYDSGDDYVEILRLGVSPFYRRMLHGTKLANRIKTKLTYGKPTLIIKVPDSHLDAHLFLSKNGFICSGILHRWFPKTKIDALEFHFLHSWGISNIDKQS